MATRLPVAIAACIVLSASLMLAESGDCTNPSIITPDGRINLSVFPAPAKGQNVTYWYGFYGQAGHSYSVEFVSPMDNDVPTAPNSYTISFNTFKLWGPNDTLFGCGGNSSVSYISTAAYSPVLMNNGYGDGERWAFIAAVSGLYTLTISNSGGTGTYSFRVVDTTFFNARWSTWSGYDTQWGFTNLSDMPISGTFSIYNTATNQLVIAPIPMTIGAGQIVVLSSNLGTGGLNLPRNTSGYAIFAHNGPPGAFLTDAYMLNGSATLVIYAKFEPRTAQ
jgi:hypothetical protein